MLMKYLLTSALALLLAATGYAADSVPWSQDFTAYNTISNWTSSAIARNSYNFRCSSGELQVNGARSNYPNEAIIFFTPDGFELTAGKDYASISTQGQITPT